MRAIQIAKRARRDQWMNAKPTATLDPFLKRLQPRTRHILRNIVARKLGVRIEPTAQVVIDNFTWRELLAEKGMGRATILSIVDALREDGLTLRDEF